MTARVLLTAAVLAACAAAFAMSAAAGGKTHSGYFRTPDKRVYCDYLYGSGVAAKFRYVRCGFNGKLVPPEPKPKGGCPKDIDYVGNRLQVFEKGRGQTQPCAGDAGPFGNPKAAVAIPYGHTWHGGGFSCTSARGAMTCKNAEGHGFHLAKRHWRVF